jgi:hypothetical protein
MSIPPSVARRAYQAAAAGEKSSFFYVRRFRSTAGGQDQYVAVTCRLAGGGARVPFSLVDVEVKFNVETPILFVKSGEAVAPLSARILYNGTGALKGRWEIVYPGEETPSERDLLTEATLPLEERGTQRRYTELSRFNVIHPPGGQFTLQGPSADRLPNSTEGMYFVLLRIEASDDKEGDSNLGAVGAGIGTVHAGAVSGFPMPTLQYVIGAGSSELATTVRSAQLQPLSPVADAVLGPDAPLQFTWLEQSSRAAFFRVEIRSATSEELLVAIIPRGPALYRPPSWIREQQAAGSLSWRVVALDLRGHQLSQTQWTSFTLAR